MSLLDRLQSHLRHKYQPSFDFYFSKDIGDICHTRPHSIPHIAFQESLCLDAHHEMLKRYYRCIDFDRIPLLAQYYAKHKVLPNESPLLFLTSGRKPLFRRIKKRIKKIFRQKEQEEGDFRDSRTYLKDARTEDLEEPSIPSPLEPSMDTVAHDIYDLSNRHCNIISKQQSLVVTPLPVFDSEQIEVGDEVMPEYLVINFDDKDTERILREYNSLAREIKHIPLLSNIRRAKDSSQEFNSPTVSKTKRNTLLPKKSNKQLIKNMRVSEEYYQGKTNLIKYKRMISINEGKQIKYKKPPQSKYRLTSNSKTHSEGKLVIEKLNLNSPRYIQPSKEVPTYRKPQRVETQLHQRDMQRMREYEGVKARGYEAVKSKQYEAMKQKAARLEDQALRTLSKYRVKGVKSSEYLPSPRFNKH